MPQGSKGPKRQKLIDFSEFPMSGILSGNASALLSVCLENML